MNIDIKLTFEEFKSITAFVQKQPWDQVDPIMQMLNQAFMRSKKLLEEENQKRIEEEKKLSEQEKKNIKK